MAFNPVNERRAPQNREPSETPINNVAAPGFYAHPTTDLPRLRVENKDREASIDASPIRRLWLDGG